MVDNLVLECSDAGDGHPEHRETFLLCPVPDLGPTLVWDRSGERIADGNPRVTYDLLPDRVQLLVWDAEHEEPIVRLEFDQHGRVLGGDLAWALHQLLRRYDPI